MTDIVERLRERATSGDTSWLPAMRQDCADAAVEIERLRAALREIEDSSNDPRAVREAHAALKDKP
jgi:alkylation response protein AidB-like acyl-CoA dehydrogenase